jgi:hypothetical protein
MEALINTSSAAYLTPKHPIYPKGAMVTLPDLIYIIYLKLDYKKF